MMHDKVYEDIAEDKIYNLQRKSNKTPGLQATNFVEKQRELYNKSPQGCLINYNYYIT
jgi:hypothetical protein